MQTIVDRLSREQTKLTLERRRANRRPFVRPVTIHVGPRGETQIQALTKNFSRLGIAIVSDVSWEVGRMAIVEIHLPVGLPVRVRCEVRWCEPFGQGWYVSGWHFLEQN